MVIFCPADLFGQISLGAGLQGSTEGFVVLDWSIAPAATAPPETANSAVPTPTSPTSDPTQPLVLQRSSSPDFDSATVTAYALGSGATAGQITLTGFPDGVYYFRAGSEGAWSDQVAVEIRHHPLRQALFFFFTGLALFLLLLGFLIHGSRAAQQRAVPREPAPTGGPR